MRWAVHARHAERQRVCFGESTQAEQSGDDRNVGFFGEGSQLVIGFRENDAMTRHNQRTLRLGDQLRGLCNGCCRRLWRSRATKMLDRTDRSRWAVGRFAQLDIFGDVNQHRTRTSTSCYTKGFMHDIGDVFDPLYEKIMLGDWLGHAKHIGLLKCVTADEVTRHLPGDCHNGCRVHVCGGQSRDKVGGPRTTSGYTHSRLPCSTGITVSSVSRGLLVSHEDMTQHGIGSE